MKIVLNQFFQNLISWKDTAMIAMVGLEKYKVKLFDNFDLPASPRLSDKMQSF